MKRVAIVGGGIAGLTVAWQLAQLDAGLDVTLFEASGRLGGTVETLHRDGFTVELGPDGWVTEKPWARELAVELGLGGELIGSNDETRVTWILRDGKLAAMPDGMRMMVPGDLTALRGSPLFSESAVRAYEAEPARAAELREAAPDRDESVASFVERHFGAEVLETVAAPLLSGVFGGEVGKLSVRAVMPGFVAMEREFGSLILGVQAKVRRGGIEPIFTTLRGGFGGLVEKLVAGIPAGWIRLGCPVGRVEQSAGRWVLGGPTHPDGAVMNGTRMLGEFDELVVATPAHVTRGLLPEVGRWLPVEESSAVLVAFGFREEFALPQGFGFLVPRSEANELLAATFVDQKFVGRVPAGARLLRAFFGGSWEPAKDLRTDEELVREALRGLEAVVGKLPTPEFAVVRRWPRSLPQYGVGHLERMAELEAWVAGQRGLRVVGNAYRGVGLPDLVRDGRRVGREIMGLG